MVSRREFLKFTGASAGALMAMRFRLQKAFAAWVGENTLNPASIQRFAAPLVIPPAMPQSSTKGGKHDFYNIGVRQFDQQILPLNQIPPNLGDPSTFAATTVWSYGNVDYPNTTFNYPAFTIEAPWASQVKVRWINELVDPVTGNFLPHLLPVDPTLHWANPLGGKNGRDKRPDPTDSKYWASTYLTGVNGSYIGPVPIVTHVHGAHTFEQFDGYPEAWYLPVANNIPKGFATTGTWYDNYNKKYKENWDPGTAEFTYPNTQRATTLWYHDHSLGMTRLNVYAGPAGFWLIRGGPDDVVTVKGTGWPGGTPAVLPGPAPTVGSDPFGTGFYEIPIVIQDRSFDQAGQLWYPYYRAFFEGLGDLPDFLQIPFTPNLALNGLPSDVAPIWQPEFFGNVMVVNGVSWPYLEVKQELYRFRLLNGCNSRFLILDFNNIPGVKVWQIGAEGGFLPDAALEITSGELLMGLAERADVIVDFRGVLPGEYILGNLGPDEPFGGDPVVGPGDMPEMREVMQFKVVPQSTSQNFTEPENLVLPPIAPLIDTVTRQVSLNEEMSRAVYVPFNAGADEFVLDTNGTLWEVPFGATPVYDTASGKWIYDGLPGIEWDTEWTADVFGPTAALLGTMNLDGTGNPLLWMAPVTENPVSGTTEMWEIHNLTVDAHPIHIHLVQFQVVNRQDRLGNVRPPEPSETGFKDTVIAYPGEITRVRATFDIPGRFVWHCHIVEHEDNEMMRPYDVV